MVYAAWFYTLTVWAEAGAPVLGVVVVWQVGTDGV
jgi:hypothetical protein